VHALSPVESFVVDTQVPEVLRLPCCEEPRRPRSEDACQATLEGDFLFHCHIEEHMMGGLAGLIRAHQKIRLTEQLLQESELVLPLRSRGDDCQPADLKRCLPHRPTHPQPGGHGHHGVAVVRAAPLPPEHTLMIERHHHAMEEDSAEEHHHRHTIPMTVPAQPAVDPTEAAQKGYWELLPCEAPVLAVHAALLHTGKVLFFAGSGNDELYTTGCARRCTTTTTAPSPPQPPRPTSSAPARPSCPTAACLWPAAPNATTTSSVSGPRCCSTRRASSGSSCSR
jgi:hypothetical protein